MFLGFLASAYSGLHGAGHACYASTHPPHIILCALVVQYQWVFNDLML